MSAEGDGADEEISLRLNEAAEAAEILGIKALNKNIVRLIGSAQVISSVVSVVKELVENSLDAESTSIEVKLENYGFDKIEVRDNGTGIKPSDTPFMGQPHYTSKISEIDDLNKLLTYGFRGEALGSLCAVSQVSITTKTTSDDIGIVYDLDYHGHITNKKPSHIVKGTTVVVSQLFHNVPVRRQFYSATKRRKEELKKVGDLMLSFCLIRPEVRFTFRHNRDILSQKSADLTSRQVMVNVFGSFVTAHMEHILKDDLNTKLKMELYVPKKDVDFQKTSRTAHDRSFIFINGRSVLNEELLKVVRQMYAQSTGCDAGRYPMCFVSLIVPPDCVDVNLEPNKTKVLLLNNDDVLDAVRKALALVYPCGKPMVEETRQQEESTLHPETSCSQFDDSASVTVHAPFRPLKPLKGGTQENNDSLSFQAPRGTSSDDLSFQKLTNPLLNSTRCDGQGQNIDAQDATFDANFEQYDEDDDIFRDLTLGHEEGISDENCRREIDIHDKLGLASTSDLTIASIHGTSEKLMIEKPGSAAETDVSIQTKEIKTLPKVSIVQDSENNKVSVLPSTTASNIAESWSKEISREDARPNEVTPVQLLMSQTLPSNNAKPYTPVSNSKASSSFAAAKKPGQMTLSDVVMMDKMKRPSNAFLRFSQEKRPLMIQQHPDTELREIGQMINDEWNALSPFEQDSYNPPVNTPTRNTSRDDHSRSVAPSSKKRKVSHNERNQSILEMMKPSKSGVAKRNIHSAPRKTVAVNFSMPGLSKKYMDGPVGSQCYIQGENYELVGEVKPAGWWISLQGSMLKALVPWRIQECLIFHRLMESHAIATEKLDDPIHLSVRNLGERIETLHSLQWSSPSPSDVYTYMTDPRVIRSGFSIRKIQGTESSKIEVTSMANCIPVFGLSDLSEILTHIGKNPSCSVRDCRPLKLMHYLQGQAIRMMRQMPLRVNREEMLDFLQQCSQKMPENTTKCFHQKPLIYPIYNLEKLLSSQA